MDWKLFGLTFSTVFLAEMGDKTQLTVFILMAQHKKVLPVFIGASLALTSVSLIGVISGKLAPQIVPPEYLQIAAGLLFVGMGAVMLIRAFGAVTM
ncbi:MAG: TMEM165/GDT1 family protein [Firmicutes bacterium]|nr:TMEM165/GDT1 family protein [Bacillota bacterium]